LDDDEGFDNATLAFGQTIIEKFVSAKEQETFSLLL
jgi:hypothetical protein